MMPRNLPAQLRADGAAASGDADHLSLHIADDGIQVDLHRIPSQKILHLYIMKLGNADLAVHQLINAGERTHLALGFLADVQDPLQLGPRKRRNGNDDLVNVVLLHRLRNLLAAANYLDALNVLAPFVLRIVNQALEAHRRIV